jgi:thioredoxin 1
MAVIHVTDANFEEEVLKSNIPVVVDLWAEWCGPCRMIGPIIEELSVEFNGKAKMTKLDVDSNPNITSKYGIRNIPTVLFFKGGEVVDKQVGAVPKLVFVKKLEVLV